MTDCGGQRREGRDGQRWNTRDAENGIEQRAIFRAEASNFVALPDDFCLQRADVLTGTSRRITERNEISPNLRDCFHLEGAENRVGRSC